MNGEIIKEKVLAHATVCFLIKENKILLAIKGRHIGEGCWNGYGGGIDPGEEPKEETNGVIALPEGLEKIAEIDFHNTKSDGRNFVCKVHFYLVSKWRGEI